MSERALMCTYSQAVLLITSETEGHTRRSMRMFSDQKPKQCDWQWKHCSAQCLRCKGFCLSWWDCVDPAGRGWSSVNRHKTELTTNHMLMKLLLHGRKCTLVYFLRAVKGKWLTATCGQLIPSAESWVHSVTPEWWVIRSQHTPSQITWHGAPCKCS